MENNKLKKQKEQKKLSSHKMISYDYIIQGIKLASMEDHIKCGGCGRDGTIQHHTCPYQEEISDNFDCYCNCCDDCMKECSNDI